MASRSKHMAGNNTLQITRLFSARNTLLALAIFSSGYTSSGYAAIGEIADNEFIVNTRTDSEQSNASAAMDADGDYVVTWVSNGQDGNGFGVFGQRFSANGAKAGDAFLVNTVKNLDQENPSIAIDADGDFVVVWQSFNQDGNNFGVYGQRFSSDANEKGTEFPINTEINSDQKNPDIAMNADGDFVVVWQSDGNATEDSSGFGVFGQLYSADGSKIGNEFLVNTEINADQLNPSVAMDANGNFVVIWQSDGNAAEDNSVYGVFGQLFNASGNKTGNEFLVNTVTNFAQENPDVAMDASGDFIVVWQSDEQDGDDAGIFGQRYNANGSTIEFEFQVNMATSFNQQNPSVAMDADGDFVVSWQSDGNAEDTSGYGVFSRIYSGSTASDEFLVNTTTDSEQSTPNVSMDADGDFIVAWQSDGNTEDTSDYGVFGQRYKGNAETIDLNLVVNDSADPVTTGNNFTYTMITTNNGTGIAMGVELTGPIPVGVTYVSDDSASAGWLCTAEASTLVCNLPFLNPGARSTINVTVESITAGTASNTVTVSAAQADSNPDDNTDTETTASFLNAGGTSSSSSGSLGWLSGVLFLFALRRRKLDSTSNK